MGVPGLWKELAPAAKVHSLTALAVVEGFEANPGGHRGFRIGIDVSIWFFHATQGKGGVNPELRTIFFRCVALLRAPFLPLFVFDGPQRPSVKRGKKIHQDPHKLVPKTQRIVDAFGFEWKVAPGEAEAELAYLNRTGVLDGILSDDVDSFLFGATIVLRNPSNTLSGNLARPALNREARDDKNHTRVYRIEDITAHQDVRLTRGDMIFIALCSGGDYNTGVLGCGLTIAKALVRCGFGRSLFEAGQNMSRASLTLFLHRWRNALRQELSSDSKGFIGSKRPFLASSIPDEFPDIDVLLSYIDPITSDSVDGLTEPLFFAWSKEPDLGKIALICESYFQWDKQKIIDRFQTIMWHGAVLRILRRGALIMDEARESGKAVTPLLIRNGLREGTSSHFITKHFSSPNTTIIVDDILITKITRARKHAYTDGLLEYRLEIHPRQLVLLTESTLNVVQCLSDTDTAEQRAQAGSNTIVKTKDRTHEIKGNENVLVWMPATMVRVAEPLLTQEFENTQERKQQKIGINKRQVLQRPENKRTSTISYFTPRPTNVQAGE